MATSAKYAMKTNYLDPVLATLLQSKVMKEEVQSSLVLAECRMSCSIE